MHKFKFLTIAIILILALVLAVPSLVAMARPLAATSPTLGALLGYSVLGGSAVTNTGSSTLGGAVGVSPGTSITNFPPGLAGGGQHSNDSSAIAARTEALTVFGTLNQPCDHSYGALDLSSLSPLVPGVYCSSSSFTLTGNLTLSSATGVYIFKTVSSLITSPGSSVTGGDPCNVWWRVGSSTTLDTTTSFIGTVISQNGANAMRTGATLNGRFIGLSAALVTLDSNTITVPVCAAATATSVPNVRATKTALASMGTAGVSGVSGVSGLPNTGGAPIRNDEFPLWMVIIASLTIVVLALGIRGYRRTDQPKQ